MLDDCETLVLALSLPVGELNFGSSVTCFVLIRLFCRYIFPLCFNVANNIVFLIFKLKKSHCLSFRSRRRSRSNFLREGYRNLNCCYFV